MFETLDKHDQLSFEIRTDPQTNTWLLTINIQTAVIGFICVRLELGTGSAKQPCC